MLVYFGRAVTQLKGQGTMDFANTLINFHVTKDNQGEKKGKQIYFLRGGYGKRQQDFKKYIFP